MTLQRLDKPRQDIFKNKDGSKLKYVLQAEARDLWLLSLGFGQGVQQQRVRQKKGLELGLEL